jgi:ubiquinone/menaquinone biosynthesis C-methylase UbiE
MTDRYRQQWEALGADDPYWAVLTDPSKKNGGWNKDEFFQTGIDEIEGLLKKISRLGIQLRFELALDYGCGVGRLSRALSTSFQRVLGVDIADAMLAEARSANAGFANIRFMRNNGVSLTDVAEGTVDFLYSNIVLQHSPRKNQRVLITEFCRVLRLGGTLIFQTPSHPNLRNLNGLIHFLLSNSILNIARRIRYGKTRIMEMHTIRKEEVLKLLREEGMTVFEAEKHDSAETAFISYRYFAVKG